MTRVPQDLAPIHPLTGKPMARCPECGKLSGLTGIDGRACLACTPGWKEAGDGIMFQSGYDGFVA